jgi:CubicO group peptidase (beta-lactamase class C family)
MMATNLPTTINEIIEKYLSPLPDQVQLAIALIQNDKTRFIGAERSRDGVTYLDNRQTVFEIGSISKVFAATMLAQTVEQGDLTLETPVQALLPIKLKQSQRDGVEISLKHLANHTSGIAHHQPPGLSLYAILRGRPWVPFHFFTQDRFEKYLQHGLRLADTPGTKYFYSNLGMSLAGFALAAHNGQSYDEMIQTQVFQPLGMDLSAMEVAAVREYILPGWRKAGKRAPNWDFQAMSPAGGVKTCVEDFAKFVVLQFSDNPAIKRTQRPSFQINEDNAVGLGWHLTTRPSGERWLNHGGGTLGYTANVLVDVEKKSAVVAFSNLNNINNWASKLFKMCSDLL